MRVALITSQWPGVRMGGIGTYTFQAAAALAAAGHEPHVFTFTLPQGTPLPAGAVVHEIANLAASVAAGHCNAQQAAQVAGGGEAIYRLALGALLCQALLEAHVKTPFAVVEAPEYEALALPLLLAANVDLPVITHIHSGSAVGRQGNGLPTTPADVATDALECAAMLGAAGLCAPSQAVVHATTAFVPLNRTVDVMPLPFQWNTAAPFVPPPQDGPIVFVGRLEQLKGADLLAAALPKFLSHCPTAHVQIIGPDTPTAPGGGSMQKWMQQTIGPRFNEHVTFHGQQDPAFITAALQHCSFCVIPSRYESFSYIGCQAMTSGRTALLTTGIGTHELLGDAAMAFTAGSSQDLAAKLETLWDDRSLLLQLSAVAHDRAQHILAPATIAAQRLAFYERIIAERHSPLRITLNHWLKKLPIQYSAALASPLVGKACALGGITIHLPMSKDVILHHSISPGRRLLAVMERIAAGKKAASVMLYGAGRFTSRLLSEWYLWESAGHTIVGLIDDDPRFAENSYHLNLPIASRVAVEARARAGEPVPPIILSTDTLQSQFWDNTATLRNLGVSVVKLYD